MVGNGDIGHPTKCQISTVYSLARRANKKLVQID